MSSIVEEYKGVKIEESCGYYYPEVNGNVECKTIQEVKDWIDNVWLFVINPFEYANQHNLVTDRKREVVQRKGKMYLAEIWTETYVDGMEIVKTTREQILFEYNIRLS